MSQGLDDVFDKRMCAVLVHGAQRRDERTLMPRLVHADERSSRLRGKLQRPGHTDEVRQIVPRTHGDSVPVVVHGLVEVAHLPDSELLGSLARSNASSTDRCQ